MAVFLDRNRLFLNDGTGKFTDVTTMEIGNPGRAFQTAVGDVDNDQDLDIFTAGGGGELSNSRSSLLLNLGDTHFIDVLESAGLSVLTQGNTEGAALVDVDNDGDLDLMTAVPGFLFLNDGTGMFTEQTALLGLAEDDSSGEPSSDQQPPTSFGDFNLDGFLDGQDWRGVFRHNGNDNHWLRVDLVGVQSNRNGIGARLVATAADLRQMQELLGGTGYLANELVVHFGLGPRTLVDSLEIRWPSGQVDVHLDVPADQLVRLFEGRDIQHRVQPSAWGPSWPDSVVASTVTDWDFEIRPALYEPAAHINSVVADLSEVGGPSEVPLTDDGDGVFRLETAFAVDVANGFKDLSVVIDQSTFLGSHWSRLSRIIGVYPAADLEIMDDGIATEWTLESSEGVESADLEYSGIAYRGKVSSAIQVQPESVASLWEVNFVPATPVDPLGFTHLRFVYHPGDARGRFTDVVNVTINDVSHFMNASFVNRDLREWQVVEIPLSAFQLRESIEYIRFSGNLEGTFYLDDIRLVLVGSSPPRPTAVLQEHESPVPGTVALDQNYPNPFNSRTVIRFALPQSQEVQLTIYNLAGQKVATLTDGLRDAGSYSVQWDGRDDEGRTLASGVYLYRLHAGDRVQTRKLVLIQ